MLPATSRCRGPRRQTARMAKTGLYKSRLIVVDAPLNPRRQLAVAPSQLGADGEQAIEVALSRVQRIRHANVQAMALTGGAGKTLYTKEGPTPLGIGLLLNKCLTMTLRQQVRSHGGESPQRSSQGLQRSCKGDERREPALEKSQAGPHLGGGGAAPHIKSGAELVESHACVLYKKKARLSLDNRAYF